MRKIEQTAGRIAQIVTGVGLALVFAVSAQAQAIGFGSSTPADVFELLDADNDEQIEPEEWDEANPFIRRILERLGIDQSQSMDLGGFQRTVREFQAKGDDSDGGGDEAPPRSLRDDNDFRGGDSFRGGGSGRSSGSDGGGRGGRDGGSSGGTTGSRSTGSRPRAGFQPRLPEAYRARDKDGDGQLGFYEWPRNDLAGFRKLDHNGDGFLTPQELILGSRKSAGTSAASPVAAAGPIRGESRSERPSGSTTSPATTSTPASASDFDNPAEKLFALTDKDKNGTISEDEWKRSMVVRPKFEKAGANVQLPMAKGAFLLLYPQVYSEK